MTQEEFLELREEGWTFAQIGSLFGLTERQVNYRTKKWGLDYSKKKSLNEDFFKGNTKAVFYWAGMLAADGWIEGERNRVGLALKSEDIGHLEKFKKAVSSDHDICPFMKGIAYRIRFNSETMVNDLNSRFNITPAKTHTYKMPQFDSEYLFWEYLRGYIDGDGHLEKTDSGKIALHLCSANKEFLEKYVFLVENYLNITIPNKIALNVGPKGQVYNVRVGVANSALIVQQLYKNSSSSTRLDRKYNVAKIVL